MDKKGNPETHTVTITVEDGNFTYDNPIIWVDRGDTIIWECTNRWPFAIHIGWGSPLEKGRYRSVDGTGISTKVLPNAQPGDYEYAVAVFEEKSRETWTDHPPFIVKRP